MSTARIAPLSPPYSEEVQASFEKLMPPGIAPIRLFRTVAHNPRVLRRMQRGGLLDPGSISLRARELVILRTTARCGTDYEWGVHVAFFGASAGVSATELPAIAHGAPEDWPEPGEAALLGTVDALHAHSTLSDDEYAQLAAHYAPEQIIEIVMLVGLYHAASFLCRATGVEREEGAPALPRSTGDRRGP